MQEGGGIAFVWSSLCSSQMKAMKKLSMYDCAVKQSGTEAEAATQATRVWAESVVWYGGVRTS